MKSIQMKLTVTILAIFAVAMATLGGLNYWKARQIIISNLNQEITTLANNSANDVNDWLETRKSEMMVMSVAPVVQS